MHNRSGIVLAAFALLGVAAVAGWVRNPQPGASVSANSPIVSAHDEYGAPVNYGAAVDSGAPVNAREPANAVYGRNLDPCVDTATPVTSASGRSVQGAVPVSNRSYAAPARTTRTTARRSRGRSIRKSVAIVAGTSGFGAAMGALAGGGKGAGIGALAGGGAGFLYDRLTNKR